MAKQIKAALKLNKRPNDKKCDFTITVGEENIRVHRSKLLKKTRYFEENYPTNFDNLNDVCEVEGFSFEAIYICIRFIYKAKISLTMETVKEQAMLSRKWQIEELVCICDDYLRNHINTQTCIRVKKLAQQLDDETIEKRANECILTHLDEVVECEDVTELSETELISIFSDFPGPNDEFGMPDLKERDAIFWKLLIKWIHSSVDERRTEFCFLLQRVPFSFFNMTLLDKDIFEEPLIKDCEECWKYITDCLLSVLEHRLDFNKKTVDFGLGNQFCLPQESFFLLPFVQKHNRDDIAEKIDESIISGFATLIDEEEYKRFEKEDLLRYLQAPGIGLKSDTALWDAIMSWIKYDSAREVEFMELFNLIKLEKMTIDFIRDIVLKEDLVCNSPACKDKLIRALLEKAA